MCIGPVRNTANCRVPPVAGMANNHHHHQTVDADESSNLLELAANNDLEAFRLSVVLRPTQLDEVGEWYERKRGSNRIVLECRTPLMVAATYGSLDVLRLILSFASVDVNRVSVPDNTTALHCAASGGSANAVDAVKMLLSAGADPNIFDANGHRPVDVIVVSPKLSYTRSSLEALLGKSPGGVPGADGCEDMFPRPLRVLTGLFNSISPQLSSSSEEDVIASADSSTSPSLNKLNGLQAQATVIEKKEYPVDPSLPDIKNSIYASDEFRMFAFKVRPCSRAYSHDWTECPFVHPGENARRRDPRKYHYSCVPCPDFRKGSCRRGDMCEYAHGVFECWLHPAQYRTRLCKDGTSCSRRVCFFAHTKEELRPLYMSTGSAMPSPKSSTSAALEMAAAMGIMPGSPSSVSSVMSPITPPSAKGMNHNVMSWPLPNVPTLHFPGNKLQASRLPSFKARDMPMDDLSMMQDFDSQQLLNDMHYSRLSSSTGNRSLRSNTMTPTNLDYLFSAEITSSPRYNSDQGTVFSMLSQFQQQQSLQSPVNTGMFPPKAFDAKQLTGYSSQLQASLGISSPGRMSPHAVEPGSSLSSRLAVLAQWEKQQQALRSLSSQDLGSGASQMVDSPVSSWLNSAAPPGSLDWGMNGEELGHLQRLPSFDLKANGDDHPDISWVHSLVKESPEKVVTAALASARPSSFVPAMGEVSVSNGRQMEQAAVLGAWLEQMQLDQRLTQNPNFQ